jgi:hypothetical protein
MAPAAPLPTPPANPDADWTATEKAFFEKHGVTDEKEKEVIRKRALIQAYDRERKAFDEKKTAPAAPEEKKWYQD